MCIYNSQQENTIQYCNANITYGLNCDKTLDIYMGMSEGSTVITPPIEGIPGVNEYCFSVSTSSGNKTIIIEGNLNIFRPIINNGKSFLSGSSFDSLIFYIIPGMNTGGIIAGVLIFVILIGIVIAIIIINRIYVHWFTRPPPLTIKFSNEKEIGSLAKILKVFQVSNETEK